MKEKQEQRRRRGDEEEEEEEEEEERIGILLHYGALKLGTQASLFNMRLSLPD